MDAQRQQQHANPFEDQDSAGSETAPEVDEAAVLTVDRNATLTLGTDSLIVLDEGLRHRRAAANCLGMLPQLSRTTYAVTFYNVLWAELDDFEVRIHFAQSTGKSSCRAASINYTLSDKTLHAYASRWVEALLLRAYPAHVKRRKRVKVLVNPFGGQGHAHNLWTSQVEPIFAAAHCAIDVEKTTHKGHATEIAEQIDVDAVDVVACASGDGLPHEVFNGLARHKNARRALRRVAVTQLPCGSGNAMSLNLNGTDSPSLAAVAIVKGVRSPLDLMAITQGNNKYYSFLSQAVGIVAESDLGTESLRWMGSFRFTWGLMVRILFLTTYPAEVSVVAEIEDKREIRKAYKHAVEEQHAGAAKQLPFVNDDETFAENGDGELAPLRFGTVTDPLSDDFQTEDHPGLGNFFVGNMAWMSPDTPFFPAALPADGHMDLINISALVSRYTALGYLLSVESGKLMDHPAVFYRKVLAYRITPRLRTISPNERWRDKIGRWLGGSAQQKEGLIAIDGERVPYEPYQAEVIPGLGTVLTKRGGLYEYGGPKAT
ncbi:hypothetical protein LTR08_002294 [Meristemomyces frigidus]|nr:hypothetical protein LTR08_002294 [Meristemomyces frigidus]